MKILHLIDSGGLYGAEVMLLSLAEQQMKMGHFPVVGSMGKEGGAEKAIEKEAGRRGIPLQIFKMRPGLNFSGAYRILRYALDENFDILHSHGYKSNILLGLIPTGLRNLPMLSTAHGWTNTRVWTKMWINEIMDSFALRFVDKVVLVNPGMLKNDRIKKISSQKRAVIENGIGIVNNAFPKLDLLEIPENIVHEIKRLCSNGKVILSIGRLSHEKGYEYLVMAFQILRKEFCEDVRLLLVGDGPQRNDLEHQVKEYGLEQYFLITGYIKEAYKLLGLGKVFIISSLTEGLPITLLEAMASRIPVVATAVGGIPHVVTHEEEALLVPSKNPRAIAEATRKLLGDEELEKRLTLRAEIKVNRYYSSKAMAERYVRLYQEVLQEKAK